MSETKVERIRTAFDELAEVIGELRAEDPGLADAVNTVNRILRIAHIAGVMRFGPEADAEVIVSWCEVFLRGVLELVTEEAE